MTAHIVLFQPKADITENDRLEFAHAMERATRDISSVRRATIGKAADIDAGYARSFGDAFTFAAVLEFDDRHGLVQYLTHPLHMELGRQFWLICERTAIIEVEIADAKTADLVELFKA